MAKPTKYVWLCHWIECLKQSTLYIMLSQFCHRHTNIVPIPAEVILHVQKSKFNWVVVRRIRWQKFISHTSDNCQQESKWNEMDLPGFNKLQNVRMFVDLAIIHDNNWIWGWERFHHIQQVRDKGVEWFSVESSLNNVTMYYATKSHCRQHQEAFETVIREICEHTEWIYHQPRQKNTFRVAFLP